MRLGCPAIQKTQKGIKIDASLCTGCGLCVQRCVVRDPNSAIRIVTLAEQEKNKKK